MACEDGAPQARRGRACRLRHRAVQRPGRAHDPIASATRAPRWTSWGVGTKLATAPTTSRPSAACTSSPHHARAPTSAWQRPPEDLRDRRSKLTVPGVLDVRRYYYEDGRIAGDMVLRRERADGRLRDSSSTPSTRLRRKNARTASASRRCSSRLARGGEAGALRRGDAMPMHAREARPRLSSRRWTRARSACSTPIRTRWASSAGCMSAAARWWRECAASRKICRKGSIPPLCGDAGGWTAMLSRR